MDLIVNCNKGFNYYVTCDHHVRRIDLPARYEITPREEIERILKESGLSNRFVVLTDDETREFLKYTASDDIDVNEINGTLLYNASYVCDETECGKPVKRYCLGCNMDLCLLCTSKHESHRIVDKPMCRTRVCDICGETIVNEFYYKCYANGSHMCLKCALSCIFTDKYELKPNYMPCYFCNFGSMFDWIPILYTDSPPTFILQNMNPDSEYFRMYAMCFETHYQFVTRTYYTIWDKERLEDILEELRDLLPNQFMRRRCKGSCYI